MNTTSFMGTGETDICTETNIIDKRDMKKARYEKRPWAIYRHSRYHGRKGYWERCGEYKTPRAALNALKDFTKRPKKERVFVYVVLKNEHEDKWVLIKDHDKLFKSAR